MPPVTSLLFIFSLPAVLLNCITSLIIFFDNTFFIVPDRSGNAYNTRKSWYVVSWFLVSNWLINVPSSTVEREVNTNCESGIIHFGFLKKFKTSSSITSERAFRLMFFENKRKNSIGIKNCIYFSPL